MIIVASYTLYDINRNQDVCNAPSLHMWSISKGKALPIVQQKSNRIKHKNRECWEKKSPRKKAKTFFIIKMTIGFLTPKAHTPPYNYWNVHLTHTKITNKRLTGGGGWKKEKQITSRLLVQETSHDFQFFWCDGMAEAILARTKTNFCRWWAKSVLFCTDFPDIF